MRRPLSLCWHEPPPLLAGPCARHPESPTGDAASLESRLRESLPRSFLSQFPDGAILRVHCCPTAAAPSLESRLRDSLPRSFLSQFPDGAILRVHFCPTAAGCGHFAVPPTPRAVPRDACEFGLAVVGAR